MLATYDKDNNLKQRYNYANGRIPVSYKEDTNTYYIAYNQVGSPRAVMDVDGNVLKAITYDSFGNIVADTNPSIKIAFGFAGGLYDEDTKLSRFGFRDYDSHSGKWTSKDPIGLAGGDTNVLAYVGGDPVNFVDPSGLWIPQAIGAAVGLGFEGYRQYQSGNFNLGRLAMAGLTGAWGGFGNFLGGITRGALAGATNNAYHQLGDPCIKFDPNALGRAAGFGAAGGLVGGGLGTAGRNMYRPIDVFKYPINKMPAPHYGAAGTAAGAAIGGGVANQ